MCLIGAPTGRYCCVAVFMEFCHKMQHLRWIWKKILLIFLQAKYQKSVQGTCIPYMSNA